jgi:hypothetical protein
MLDVHAFDIADAAGESEHLWLAEWFRREPAAVALVDNRGSEAFFDGGPDGERRSELVPVDGEVAAVSNADLVDRGEEMIGGVASEDVGQAGFNAHAADGEQTARRPCVADRELFIAEFDATGSIGIVGMGRGRMHRHVDVVAARLKRCVEQRAVEAGVARVHDHVGLDGPSQCDDRGAVRGIETR